MSRSTWLTLAFAGVISSTLAHAGPLEDANAANDEGKRLYAQRDYGGALVQFRAAWALSRQGRYMFNLASVLDDMGRNAEAVEAYETHLHHPDTRPDEATATWAQKRIAVLTPKTGKLHVVTGRPEATFTLGARELEGRAGIVDALADPGSIVLSIKAGDQSHSVVLDVRAGETVEVDVSAQLAPRTAPADDPPPHVEPPIATPVVTAPPPERTTRPVLLNPLGLSFAGGAAIALGIGFYYLHASSADEDALDESPTLAAHDQLLERAGDRRTIAQVGLVAGGVLAAAATIRFVLLSRRDGTTVGVRALPGGGTAVTLKGHF